MTAAPPRPRSGPPPTRREARRHADLGSRLLVAIPAIIFAIVIVAWGGGVFLAGALALGLVCLHELYTMAAEIEPVRLGGFVGLLGLGCAAFFGDGQHVLLALVATIPVVFAVGLVQARPPGMAGTAVTLLGLTWVGLAVAHAVLLRELEHGGGVIVSILVGTFAGDTGAYLGGRSFGRTLLAPSISPHKTREGLVIGTVTAVVFVWLAGLYQDWMSGTQALHPQYLPESRSHVSRSRRRSAPSSASSASTSTTGGLPSGECRWRACAAVRSRKAAPS